MSQTNYLIPSIPNEVQIMDPQALFRMKMAGEVRVISGLLKEGRYKHAAGVVLGHAVDGLPESPEVLKALVFYRNRHLEMMYELEELIADRPPEDHDKAVRSLAAAGWYGERVPGLMFHFRQPAFRLETEKT